MPSSYKKTQQKIIMPKPTIKIVKNVEKKTGFFSLSNIIRKVIFEILLKIEQTRAYGLLYLTTKNSKFSQKFIQIIQHRRKGLIFVFE